MFKSKVMWNLHWINIKAFHKDRVGPSDPLRCRFGLGTSLGWQGQAVFSCLRALRWRVVSLKKPQRRPPCYFMWGHLAGDVRVSLSWVRLPVAQRHNLLWSYNERGSSSPWTSLNLRKQEVPVPQAIHMSCGFSLKHFEWGIDITLLLLLYRGLNQGHRHAKRTPYHGAMTLPRHKASWKTHPVRKQYVLSLHWRYCHCAESSWKAEKVLH